MIDLLAKEGTNKTFEEIGRDCIKVDILTGVITKDTTGDLLISMYAMTKIAEVNGLTLHAERIDFDELKSQLTLNDSIILHVNRNHYVVLVDINETDGTVTYKDLSVGESGQDITLSRAEFMEEWQGYVLSKNEIQNTTDEDNKYLNEAQEKNIRGAGWWNDFWKGVCTFFQAVVAPIATILMVIPGVQILGAALHGLNMIIQTISFAVGTGSLFDVALAGIQAFTAGIIGSHVFALHTGVAAAQTLANSISTTLKGIFSPILSIFKPITTIVSGIATGIGSIFTPLVGDAIAATLTTTIIGSAVNLSTSFLFDTLEIDPSLSYFGSALLSGLSMGMATGDPVNIIAGALRAGTIAGMEVMGDVADLDPNVVHLAAMTAGSLTGGFITTQDGIERSYQDIIQSIQQNIISECAYVSVTEVGELLGVDPRISYLAGVGIRSAINPQIDPTTGHPRTVWDSAMLGLAQGITNIGLNYATDVLDLNPLIANIGFSAIAVALQAGIQAGLPDGEKDIFKGMFKAYKANVLTFLGYADPSDPNYAWKQAAYTAQILDFTDIIKEQGLEAALNTYATSFFSTTAVNAIVSSGLTIGQYFMNELQQISPEQQEAEIPVTDENGNEIEREKFERDTDGEWDLVGKADSTSDSEGDLGVDSYGSLGYYSFAELYEEFGDFGLSQTVENGYQTYAEITDFYGNPLFIVVPTEDGGCNYYNSYGEYIDVVIQGEENLDSPLHNITLDGDTIVYNQESGIEGLTITSKLEFDELTGRYRMFAQDIMAGSERLSILQQVATGIDSTTGDELTFGERFTEGLQEFGEFGIRIGEYINTDITSGLLAYIVDTVGSPTVDEIVSLADKATEIKAAINERLAILKEENKSWEFLNALTIKLRAGPGDAVKIDIPGGTAGHDFFAGLKFSLVTEGWADDLAELGAGAEVNYAIIDASLGAFAEKQLFDVVGDWEAVPDGSLGVSGVSVDTDNNITVGFTFHKFIAGVEIDVDINALSDVIYSRIDECWTYFRSLLPQ